MEMKNLIIVKAVIEDILFLFILIIIIIAMTNPIIMTLMEKPMS